MNKSSIMAKGIVVAMGVSSVLYAQNDSSLNSSLGNWTGFYAGAHVGAVFNHLKLRSQQLAFTNPGESCNINTDFDTFSPGIQLGYLHQFPGSLVSGIEANIAFNANQKKITGCSCPDNPDTFDRFSFKKQMQSAIKGRLGRAIYWKEKLLFPYLAAGASFINAGLAYKNEGGDYYSHNTNQTGVLAGAGIEWSLKSNWSLRAEYHYVNYGNAARLVIPNVYGLDDPNGYARVNASSNNIAVAINYWI